MDDSKEIFDFSSLRLPGDEDIKNNRGDDSMPKWPFRAVITGASGSGKTNLLMNLAMVYLDIDKLIVCAKQIDEHNYLILRELCEAKAKQREKEIEAVQKRNDKALGLGHQKVSGKLEEAPVPFEYIFTDDMNEVPTVDELKQTDWKKTQTLAVWDDMITEKDLRTINEYYIRSRKVNVSCVFITQSYYAVPPIIRKQCSVAWIYGPVDSRSALVLAQNFKGSLTSQEFAAVLDGATKEPYSFLYVDELAPRELRFRRGLSERLETIVELDEGQGLD